ncbi:MAG: hypothetical protein JW929_14535 [Anaerolineales bacterium]|nr:hypothetical protein [Anaerolineales bacterium]
MREWNLQAADPLSLFLAADARFCAPDYADDQVWELCLRGGDPPALAAETMLGLRAVSLRLFPVFISASRPVQDPAAFASPPAVRRFAPNYLKVYCAPNKDLVAVCEYWVPDSHTLAGRITLNAAGPDPVSGECLLAGILRPAAEGSPFTAESAGPYEGVYLRGKVRNAVPVLVAAAAAGIGRGAVPSLKVAFEAGPERPAFVRWVFSCLPTAEEGLRSARVVLAREWDAETARIELAGESIPDFETGRKDWDAVLAFSQTSAIQSLVGATRHLPHASPVNGRNPERGYSLRGDGGDYAPAWSGANLADLMLILPVWALARTEAAKDLLRNYLVAAGEGLPDARPGAGRQRAGLLAPPLLAQAAGRATAGREDPQFVAELWPLIERTLEAWFDPAHDRDQDGAPEWDRADSLGPETAPMFARREPHGGWILPEEVESPSLAALLAGECSAAARLSRLVDVPERAQYWNKRGGEARRALEKMAAADAYRTLDRVTHASPAGRNLWCGRPGGSTALHADLEESARILLRCSGAPETRPILRVILSGRDAQGKECEEEFRGENFFWLRGAGACFSRTVWKRIDAIRAAGPAEGMEFRIDLPGLRREDLSHFLPLWSRSVPAARAEALLGRLAAGSAFDSRFGLRFVPRTDPAAGVEDGGVWMVWNMLMGEAALRLGKGDLVLEWVEKWMDALAASLRADHSFRSCYDPERGAGWGPRNSLQGIFPVGLFLSALGVHPVSTNRLWAGGRSIFPFPVTIRWRGMTILREGETVRVEFPSGRIRHWRGSGRMLIADEE